MSETNEPVEAPKIAPTGVVSDATHCAVNEENNNQKGEEPSGSDSNEDPGPAPLPKTAEDNDDSSDDDNFGPAPVKPKPLTKKALKRRKIAANESLYLENLPSAQMYELSYMHRDTILEVVCHAVTEFIITGSVDGRVKFWKKQETGIEFVKHFVAHRGELVGMALSADGLLLCTIAKDNHFKLFDVVAFDMIYLVKLAFTPYTCAFVHPPGAVQPLVAISDESSPSVHIFAATETAGSSSAADVVAAPLRTLTIHNKPVHTICFSPALNVAFSADPSGSLEMWHPDTLQLPTPASTKGQIKFEYKSDTDFYECIKSKTYGLSLTVSPNGEYLAMLCEDYLVRVFRTSTGKKVRVYDESLEMYSAAQTDPKMEQMRLDRLDFGRRLAVEKELRTTSSFCRQRVVFDETSSFLCYPTLIGIKIINLLTNKLVRVLGKAESGERFLCITLCQSKSHKGRVAQQSSSFLTGSTHTTGDAPAAVRKTDPLFFSTAYKKHRFYLFSTREPVEGTALSESRDVFNELPTKEEQQAADIETGEVRLGKEATIHTTMGDIRIKLFYKEVPKTVENFTVHTKNGYYDTCLFHRVIKGFMVQTGDPNGDGTGGESIWGGEFEDEFQRSLKHDRPFTVSMANCGKDTNGSQFFITTVACPWLDNKHTVFGRVIQGMDVVTRLENVRTNSDDRPYQDVRIMTIKINA